MAQAVGGPEDCQRGVSLKLVDKSTVMVHFIDDYREEPVE
ncbi:Uncharacterised protein [Mycobacterium tuberculosis]|uniref:Uncharacterized protein n=1 Tax=Mycobacterium tuberculosis TaxID=1773 RepID=A0A916LBP0_MYCTX|nr:Uncharacterised protein [Mycobacterium tuberculosis]COW89206.1 Uncharacterised protein [Mycobacterium tuberculosis]COY32791.1 Uncharacterised protein [Mycobacterium tuberculosis]CPA26014.1 Uncharacterised protein [Mycobacterium tuberculosis]